MKIQWFLSGLVGVLCFASPALAGELSSWQFNQQQNRLEFTTDEGVQPRAQLVPDPTRLVIDLPGTVTGNVLRNQAIGGAIQQIRIGQVDANTARIVVELAPGYTLDPQQIQFYGATPTQWSVQLPEPQSVGTIASSSPALPIPGATTSGSTTSGSTTSGSTAPGTTYPAPSRSTRPDLSASSSVADRSAPAITTPPPMAPPAAATQIESLRITDDGLFVRTSGTPPELETDRSRNQRSITITVEDAALSPQLAEQELAIEPYGIHRLQFVQLERESDQPPAVQITLEVDRESPDWRASVSGLGGIVLLPQGGTAALVAEYGATDGSTVRSTQPSVDRAESPPPADPASPQVVNPAEEGEPPAPRAAEETVDASAVATIQGIELDLSQTQLLIRSDRPVSYTGRWQSGMYQVTLSPARLADQVIGPELTSSSPLLRVRLRQESDDTVVILIQPASGVRFGGLNAVSPQLLALEMERSTPSAVNTPSTTAATASATPRSSGAASLRLPSNGRLVVAIDPGHGGADVGAVGINDLYEADIVLPIAQQVSALLEQQGVQAILTRSDDSEIDLEPRVQTAEQADAALFVSIHANSMGMDRPDINGTETYYYSSGEDLAEVIQSSIVATTGMDDRGIRQARFYVLRRTSMPAVLVEIGYVTGAEDAPRLADPAFRSQLAQAIAQGILQYIQQNSSLSNR